MRRQSARAKPMSISRASRNGERLVRHVRRRDRLQQLARARALHVDLRVGRRHVGHERVRVRREVPPHPRLDVTMRGVGGDDHEALVVELRDREVGLELPRLVQPLRVGHAPGVAVDVAAGDPVEKAPGVTALDEELRHEGHVHQDHALARGLVLGLPSTGTSSAGPTRAGRHSGVAAVAARTSRRPPSR